MDGAGIHREQYGWMAMYALYYSWEAIKNSLYEHQNKQQNARPLQGLSVLVHVLNIYRRRKSMHHAHILCPNSKSEWFHVDSRKILTRRERRCRSQSVVCSPGCDIGDRTRMRIRSTHIRPWHFKIRVLSLNVMLTTSHVFASLNMSF